MLLVATLAFFRGIIGRLAIFLAVVVGYALALILGEVDMSKIAAALGVALPEFHTPTFTIAVLPMFLPAVIALIAENIGHVKSRRAAQRRRSGVTFVVRWPLARAADVRCAVSRASNRAMSSL